MVDISSKEKIIAALTIHISQVASTTSPLYRITTFFPNAYQLNYKISKEISRNIYNPRYPTEVKYLGDLIRKARIDLNLQIKDLAKILNVREDTIINWE